MFWSGKNDTKNVHDQRYRWSPDKTTDNGDGTITLTYITDNAFSTKHAVSGIGLGLDASDENDEKVYSEQEVTIYDISFSNVLPEEDTNE